MKENEKLNEKQVLDYNERTDKALQNFTMFFQAVLEEVQSIEEWNLKNYIVKLIRKMLDLESEE